MKTFGYLILVAIVGCVSPPSTETVEQHSDSTCVSDPLAPDGDDGGPDGDLVAQCHQDQVYNATVAGSSVDSRIRCQIYPTAVNCTATWLTNGTWGECRIYQCGWSLVDGLHCSQAEADQSYCA